MRKRKSTDRSRNFITLFVLFFILFGFVVWFLLKSNNEGFIADTKISSTPTPTSIPLHQGKGIYNISQSKSNGPTITSVLFDPLDIGKNEWLTIEVQVSDPSPIQTVTGTLLSDHSELPVKFTSASIQQDNGNWHARFKTTDSYFYTYILTITATTENGSSTISVAPRSK